MIADSIIARLAGDFLKARDIGVELDGFVADWQAQNPEFADDAQKVRDAIAQAISADNLVPAVAEGLAGAFKAIVERHGEPGKASAHAG